MAAKEDEGEIVKLKVGAVNNIAVGFARQMMKVWRGKKEGLDFFFLTFVMVIVVVVVVVVVVLSWSLE